MIIECPRCGRKNRLPNVPGQKGVYQCSACRETLAKSRQPPVWKPPKAVAVLNALFLLALLTLTVSNAVGPERWWLGSLNLYLPQWLWAVPGAVVLAVTALAAWRWAWVPLLALGWVFGPVMGWCGYGGSAPAESGGTRLRVMTYNVKWGSRDGGAGAVGDIARFHPDLIQMQDSGGVMQGAIGRALAGWNVQTSGQFLVASRLPLTPLEDRDLSFDSHPHHCVRYQMQVGGQAVTVYNVHLLSPREGLVAARHTQSGDGMEANADARLWQARRLSDMVALERGPVLLTGDLNAPTQSLVCRRLFGAGLRDAFSESGVGYGYTYGAFTRVGRPYVRIDHILASAAWRLTGCRVGNATGSDHCPVIADLALPTALPTQEPAPRTAN